jgi:citrate synthase
MDWITAPEALDRLKVRPQTLYAYVSRRRIETRPDPADPRRSLYRAADVAALTTRKARGRKASDVAAAAIAFGDPVLASGISTVAHGRLYYRGRDAVRLAGTETLEATARLLRGGHGAALKGMDRAPSQGADFRARAFAALGSRAAVDLPMLGRNPLALAAEAGGLLQVLVDAGVGDVGEGPAHVRLARAWNVGDDAADLIRRILVLAADHELNASTFAARVAASTGASLAASLLAGFCALTGPRHGMAAEALRRLLEEAGRDGAAEAVRRRLAEGRPIPGFGHPLYPEGDPRAAAILACVTPTPALAALAREVEAVGGEKPNIDFALVAAAEAYGLPPDAPFVLFAVGRAAGWIAHAIEQAGTPGVIRPRARYVGPEPETPT